jgi:hypothetical protein
MTRLEPRADRTVFAPLIWRLAMKIEQIPWSELAASPTDAVYVLRSAQRLFLQDVHCVWFDTWLEAEAAGMRIERDALGIPLGTPEPIADWPSVESILSAEPIARAVEILRRLALDPSSGIVPVATMTAGATLHRRFGGAAACPAKDRLDYIREILLGLTRRYCEAGAGALLLLDEQPGDDPIELTEYSALFNLAEYFATPVFVLSRLQVRPEGIAAANALGAKYLTPNECSDDLIALPTSDGDVAAGNGWIAMSRWEIDPQTDPNAVRGWRQALLRN